jgi:hypothetical protein
MHASGAANTKISFKLGGRNELFMAKHKLGPSNLEKKNKNNNLYGDSISQNNSV